MCTDEQIFSAIFFLKDVKHFGYKHDDIKLYERLSEPLKSVNLIRRHDNERKTQNIAASVYPFKCSMKTNIVFLRHYQKPEIYKLLRAPSLNLKPMHNLVTWC